MSAEDTDLAAIGQAIVDALSYGGRVVVRGWRATPVSVPLGSVAVAAIASETGPVLGQYTHTVTYQLQAWDVVTSRDPGAMVQAAEALADQVHGALETARLDRSSPLYTLPTFVVRSTTALGDEELREDRRTRGALGDVAVPAGCVLVLPTVELTYRRRTGLSGRDTP